MSRSQITQEILMNAETVAKNGTSYTSSRKFADCTGNAALFIASTAGSITVTQQCSMDNITFYDPVDTAGSALGGVRATLTVTTGVYTAFTPVLAPWIRFKVVEGNVAETVVTVKLVHRLEV